MPVIPLLTLLAIILLSTGSYATPATIDETGLPVSAAATFELPPENVLPLPGEDVHFQLKMLSSTHHLIHGKVSSDIGKMLFKCRLMPSNEVKLSVKLKQDEIDDIELTAYFDLANFEMELDGHKSVLNKDHKQLMKYTVAHLQKAFETKYQDYDLPDHALLLNQILSYWSVSPEGYVHDQRTVVSQY